MDQKTKDIIEEAMDKFTKENGSLEIFNKAHIMNVSIISGVCPGLIYDYLREQVFG